MATDPASDPAGAEEFLPPVPDALDLVVEAQAMLAVLTAQQYARVEAMWQDALADAARHGHQLTGIMERSVRLELAAALGITETAAGRLLGEADALVNRYPAALDALAGGRITPRHATVLVEALDGVEPVFREQLLGPAVGLAESLPVG